MGCGTCILASLGFSDSLKQVGEFAHAVTLPGLTLKDNSWKQMHGAGGNVLLTSVLGRSRLGRAVAQVSFPVCFGVIRGP